MPNIQRQVTPYIGLRRRDPSACRYPQLEKRLDTPATSLQSQEQTPTRHLPAIDELRCGNSVFLAESPDPPAPGVVQMGGDRTNCAPWFSRNRSVPEHGWKLLDEVGGNEAVRPPRGEDRRPQIRDSCHSLF